jgi:hypothetical protein
VILTPDLLETIKATYLPADAADNGWDDAKITEEWVGNIPGTVRAYWYDRVQQTAGYLDIPDPGGTLPITQLHRQAMEMLQYWDNWILKYGGNVNGTRSVSFGKIKKRYSKGNPFPMPIGPLPNGPYNYTD